MSPVYQQTYKLEFVKFFTYTKYQFIPTIEFIDQNENLVFHLS